MQGIRGLKRGLLILLLAQCWILSPFAAADWRDQFGPPKLVYLSDLLKHPSAWLDTPVRLHVRFSRPSSVYNPFFTQFSRDEHFNFAIWDIQTPIWNEDGFNNDYPYIYVSKRNPEFKSFLKLRTFDTVCIMGKVVSIFDERPYIEAVWVCHLPGYLDVYNLRMLHQAMKSLGARDFQNAVATFQKIFPTNPPSDIQAMMYKTMAKIHMYENRNFASALAELDKGKLIAPADQELLTLHRQCFHYLQFGGQEPRPGDATTHGDIVVPSKPAEKAPEKKAPDAGPAPDATPSPTDTTEERIPGAPDEELPEDTLNGSR
jgi:hypothetical protein